MQPSIKNRYKYKIAQQSDRIKQNYSLLDKANFIVSVITGAVSICLAIIGIRLSITANALSIASANQAQRIENFDVLLKTSQENLRTLARATDELSSEVKLLDTSLRVSQAVQTTSNRNIELTRRGHILRLYMASWHLLQIMQTKAYKDGTIQLEAITEIQSILYSQMDNTFLMENAILAGRWIDHYNRLNHFQTYFTVFQDSTRRRVFATNQMKSLGVAISSLKYSQDSMKKYNIDIPKL